MINKSKLLFSVNHRFLVFREIEDRFNSVKSKRVAFQIIEAAINCFARKGFENVTKEMISRDMGISRQFLSYYFSDLKDIRLTSIKYIRLLFQKLVLVELETQKTIKNKMSVYIQTCFVWIDLKPMHARVWLSYLHQCMQKVDDRQLNSLAADTGRERIEILIRMGVKSQNWTCEKPEITAKILQTLITGAMIVYATEVLINQKQFLENIKISCFTLLNSNVPI